MIGLFTVKECDDKSILKLFVVNELGKTYKKRLLLEDSFEVTKLRWVLINIGISFYFVTK